MKPTVTDRDIGDLVHYELIGIQREFSINEGIIIFVANHFIEYIIKCVAKSQTQLGNFHFVKLMQHCVKYYKQMDVRTRQTWRQIPCQ